MYRVEQDLRRLLKRSCAEAGSVTSNRKIFFSLSLEGAILEGAGYREERVFYGLPG
jgi:hypothetical protein